MAVKANLYLHQRKHGSLTLFFLFYTCIPSCLQEERTVTLLLLKIVLGESYRLNITRLTSMCIYALNKQLKYKKIIFKMKCDGIAVTHTTGYLPIFVALCAYIGANV